MLGAAVHDAKKREKLQNARPKGRTGIAPEEI